MKDSKILILLLVILFVVWVVFFNKKSTQDGGSDSVVTTADNHSEYNSHSYELTNDNHKQHHMEDAYELLGNVDVDKAFQLGFGMGPGLYGSGRQTFEMNVL